jgi:hypothetical protein
MTSFSTQRIGSNNPSIHPKKDDTPTPDDVFFFAGQSPGAAVELLPDIDNDNDWVRVERRKISAGPFVSGWMRRGHLDKELPPPAPDPVAVDEFVRACAREEMALAVSDAAHTLRADYLIALAGIESGFANFGAPAAQTDRIGPYHFGSVTWDEVAKDARLTISDRFTSLNQIIAASAIARRDWAAFSALTAGFVPRYLDLFHAWLVGVPAAQEVNQASANAAAMMGALLQKHHPNASAVMDARVEFLRGNKTVGGTDLTVAEFVQRTTKALGDALTEAGKLLVQHFPEFIATDNASTNAGDDAGSKPGRKTFQVSSAGKIDVSEVDYTKFGGPGNNFASWIRDACTAAGVPPNADWIDGYTVLCRRESSLLPNAINKTDSNARGTIVADGSPALCSRGIAQCIPPTFATFHAAGTSKAIYDPVANIAASIRYVLQRYKVSVDGSDLARKVQQADPNRPGRGY